MRVTSFFLTLLLLFITQLSANVENTLCRIANRSRESKSDAVIILHQGKPLFEYRSGKCWEPLDAMSITKSITALAIGFLIEDGYLTSVDEPVYKFYPEWEQGIKRQVTVRHLLTHTSGIHCMPDEELESIHDIVQLALCADICDTPGTKFSYNNKAVNLLSGIVKKASNLSLSQYLKMKLFDPLCINQVYWLADCTGNDFAHAHMCITAPDLAKIGEVLANGGVHQGQQVISQAWIHFLTSRGQEDDPFSGKLWWMNYYDVSCHWDESLLDAYLKGRLGPDVLMRLRSLQGRVLHMDGRHLVPRGHKYFNPEVISILGGVDKTESFVNAAKQNGLPIARWNVGKMSSYAARGWLGQQLIIFPEKNVVAVRLISANDANQETADSFHDLTALVEELIYRMEF